LLKSKFTKKIDPITGRTKYQDWLFKQEQSVTRSKEDFVRHYKDKYGFPLPIWVTIELWDFGLLSNFYQGMAVNDKIKHEPPPHNYMKNMLKCLYYLQSRA